MGVKAEAENLEEVTAVEEERFHKVMVARSAKQFALSELGVAPNPSFLRLDLRPGRTYGVYASRSDELLSVIEDPNGYYCFGKYHDARAEERKLSRQGNHTNLISIEALALRSMPITPELLRLGCARIAETVFHEQFHLHLQQSRYGRYPLHVEEPLAITFGFKAAQQFFSQNKRMSYEIEKSIDIDLEFFEWVIEYFVSLQEAYQIGEEDGQAVLQQARDESVLMPYKLHGEMNNAWFVRQFPYALNLRQMMMALSEVPAQDMIQHPLRLMRRLEEAGLYRPGK